MKKMKKLWIVLGIIIVVIAIAIGVVLFTLEKIVKTGVETVGPKLTGVSMKMEHLDISLLRGRVELGNFIIGNPEGYGTEYAIKVGNVAIEVVPMSVMSEKILVKEVTITDVHVNFETNILKSNLTDIINNLKEKTGAGTKEKSVPTTADDDTKKAASKKLQIDKIDIHNNTVTVAIKGSTDGAPIPLPFIKLENLGHNSDGVTIPEVAQAILMGLVNAITDSVKGINISLPEISLPEISLPEISIPEIEIPKIEIPEVNIPEIKVPEIKVPEIKGLFGGGDSKKD